MKLTNILEDNAMLFEQHKKYSQQTLTESCNGLNALQRTIIEGIHADLTPLVDASLSANRVDRLLNCATTKERNNMLFDSINNHIKKIDKWCINSSPITDFSDRFTKLAETITTQFNSNYIISESLNALYQYSNEYPSQRATILGLLTSIASLSPSNYGVTIAEQLLTKSIDLSNYVVESIEPQYANSTTTTAKVLTEGQVYLIFDKVCDRNNRALSESKLIDVADPYTPKTSMWDKVQDKQGYLESRYTSVLTPSTLTKLWEEAGSPQRAGDLAIFLGNSRINGVVVQKTFESLRIPLTSHDLQLLSEGPFGQAVARGTRKAAANVGAIAGGIAGIPSAVKRGFNIGKKRVGGRGAGNTQADPNAANQTDPNAANQTDPNAANQTSGGFMSDFKNGYRQGRTGKLDAAPDDSTPDSTDSSTTSGGKGKITPQDERIYQQIKYNYDQLSVPVKQKIVKALSSNSKTLVNPAQDEEEGQAQVRDLGVPQQQGTGTPQQQGKQGTSTPQQQGKQGTSTPQQQGTGTPPTGPNTPPAKQGTSTTPQQGTSTTPQQGTGTPQQQGTGTPQQQGTSTTPQQGTGTPPTGPNTPPAKQGTGTPQQQGTGTPQQQGTGTPPTGPNTPPAKQGTGTPQQQGTNTVNTRVPRMSAPNSRVNQQPVSSKKKEVDNGPSPEQVRKDKQAAARDRIDQEFGVRTPDPTNLMLPHETPGDVRNRLQQAVIRDRIDQEFGVRTPDPRPTSTASPGQTRIQRLPAALDRVDREFNDPTINPPAKQGTNTPPAKQGTNTPPAKQGTNTPPAGPNTPPAGPNTPPAKQGTSTPPAKQGTSTPPAKQGTSTPPAKQGTSTPPAGPNTPPAGPNTPPAGPNTPPASPNTPPAGPNTPPAGPNTPPAGPNTPPAKQGTSTPPAKQGTSTPPAKQGTSTPPAKQGTSTPPAGPNTPPAKQGTSTPPAKQGTSTPPAGPNTPPAKQGTSTSSQISTPNSGVNQRPSSVNNAVDSNIDDTKATTIQGKRAPPLPTLKTDNSLPSQVRNRKQAAARNRIDLEFNSPTTYPQRAPLKDLDRTAYDSPPGTKGNYTSNSRTPTNASVGKSFTANTNPNSTSNYGTQNAGTASYNAPKAKTPTTDFSVKRYDDTKPTTIQGKRAPPLPTLRAKPTATSFSDNTTTQQKPATNKVKNDLANSGKSKKNNRSNRLNKKLNRLSKVSDSVEYNIERMISENFSMFRDHRKDLTEAPVGTIKNAINKAVEVPANAFVRGSAAVSNTINAGVNAIRNTQDAVKSVGNFGYRGRAKPSSYDNDDRSYGDVDYGNDVNESIYVKQALSKIFAGRRLKPEDINNIKSFLDKIDRYQFKMSIDHTGTKQVLNKLLNNETLTYNDTTIARALFKAI